MNKRILAKDTPSHTGSEILIQGYVHARRDHGKLIFLDLRDRSGLVQVVLNPKISESAHKVAEELRPEYVVSIKGKVKARPEKLINNKIESGSVEVEALDLEIIAKAEILPFDMGGEELNLELPTLLDHRSLTLRHERIKKIFIVQAELIEEFRYASKELDCVEIVVPTIAAGATEGGAEVFPNRIF
jgi:aspartyl-tRNA synthetase